MAPDRGPAQDWQELTRLTQGRPIVVERVRLADRDIAVEGRFELPQLARLTAEDQVFVMWLLLLPFAVVLLPVFVIACLAARLPPVRTLSALWGVASALGGTRFGLDHKEASIRIHL